jgi:alkylation response protein AidB-like acyl-CoA dehydrogenase
MTDYHPPIDEARFALEAAGGLSDITALPGFEEVSADLVDAVLEAAGKLAGEVIAPLNRIGDTAGCRYENGVVYSPDGFRDAYRQYVEGGWNGLPFDPAHGGQGMPWLLAMAVQEFWNSACMSFALCPLLGQGAAQLLSLVGTDEQKERYLTRIISGEWSATMNLTEPQAGSDIGLVRTKAEPAGDHYLIKGQKIFITYGEHDLAENIIHLVLARTPDAPAGVKGISLFLVPKFLVGEDGNLGARNDLRCISLEHKLGIHASPTAVMAFGENEGAIGYLIGEENQGLANMFVMMNNARLGVGLQGTAIAERAYQQALAYAKERRQGYASGHGGEGPATIIHHPDVRSMLMRMKALIEASRGLAYYAASRADLAHAHPDASTRAAAQEELDLLTPVIKAWSSDNGIEIASLGVQVHGGMGFIEETGAAQHYRDARICSIYEGTNGIQASDLLRRKLVGDKGAALDQLMARMAETQVELTAAGSDHALALGSALSDGLTALREASGWLLETYPADADAAAAGATPYLKLFGIVAGGWIMARSLLAAEAALAAGKDETAFLEARCLLARFYGDAVLPEALGLSRIVGQTGTTALKLAEGQF